MKSEACPKCGSSMVGGFLVDRDHGPRTDLPVWYEGEPNRWWFGTLKLRGRPKFRVETRRCRRCGYLESFAASPA